MDGNRREWELKRRVIQLLQKEADALLLARELLRTGNLSQPWIGEVLRSANLVRMERLQALSELGWSAEVPPQNSL